MWEHIIFDKFHKSFPIYCPVIHIAGNISVHCVRWQKTEVGGFLTSYLRTSSLTSANPAVISFTKLVVQARLINEDNLVSTPARQLRVPMVTKFLVSFSRLFLKLYIS